MKEENLFKYEFRVVKFEENQRLDRYIGFKIKEISRSRAQLLILNSQVKINGIIEKNVNRKIKDNDLIQIDLDNTVKSKLSPYRYNLHVVYEDDDLMVVNKPAGMTVHPGANTGSQTLVNALINYEKPLSTVSGIDRPGIVHRLDKDTSGLMLIAKNNVTHLCLSKQILERKVKRKYLALVYGMPNPILGKITTGITKSSHDHTKMQVVKNKEARIATTYYRILNTYNNKMFSLVECELETGRTHQIRVHMKFKNNPIVGDQKYSNNHNLNSRLISYNLFDKLNKLNRQALQAYKICFLHPRNFKLIELEIPMDIDIKNIVDLFHNDR